MQGMNRRGEGGAEPLGYVRDPGSELPLHRRETKVRAKTIKGMEEQTNKKKNHESNWQEFWADQPPSMSTSAQQYKPQLGQMVCMICMLIWQAGQIYS